MLPTRTAHATTPTPSPSLYPYGGRTRASPGGGPRETSRRAIAIPGAAAYRVAAVVVADDAEDPEQEQADLLALLDSL